MKIQVITERDCCQDQDLIRCSSLDDIKIKRDQAYEKIKTQEWGDDYEHNHPRYNQQLSYNYERAFEIIDGALCIAIKLISGEMGNSKSNECKKCKHCGQLWMLRSYTDAAGDTDTEYVKV